MSSLRARLLGACASLLLAAPAALRAAEPIELYYFERPPYATLQAGTEEVAGLTATPAAQAFRAAGMAFRWVAMPSVRQLVTLKENPTPACGLGWFKNAEREQSFKFTRSIYRDRPTVGLARVDYNPAGLTLAEALVQPGLRVLVKDGFSYGPAIDTMLVHHKPEKVLTSADNAAMVQMIAGQRAHFMFAAEEEATFLVDQARLHGQKLKILRFGDVPPGERRYLMCSKTVPDDAIDRLNKVIAAEP